MYYDGFRCFIAGSHTDGKPCIYKVELDGSISHNKLNPNSTGARSEANDVCVSGNKVYTVGHKYFVGISDALFWSGTEVELIEQIGSHMGANTESIFLAGETIYIGGENKTSDACYWKRNINSTVFSETVLCENRKANAVFVVQ